MKMNCKTILNSRTGARWVLADFTVGFVSMLGGLMLSPYVDVYEPANQIILSIFHGLTLVWAARVCGLVAHHMQHHFSRYDILVGAFQAATMAFLIVAIVVNLTHLHAFGRYVIITTFLLSYCGITATRFIVKWLLVNAPLKMALLGSNHLSQEMMHRLKHDKHFDVVCVTDVMANAPARCNAELPYEFRPIGRNIDQFVDQLKAEGVDMVVSCYTGEIHKQVYDLMEELPFHHIDLINKGSFMEIFFREISVSYRNLHWQSSSFFKPARGAVTSLKRGGDLAISGLLLLLLSPLMALVAILVKRDSSGPAIYSQTRSGKLGEPFTIYKFRTMAEDSEKNGAQWASKNDPRVTRIGKFLRKTRLDELPQLWNVFKGDMSLVGPRPERPEFITVLNNEVPLYDWRLLVKPGLTGWAQILFKYGESVEDSKRKLQYDLYYIKNFSLALDFQILLRTFHLLMKGSQ